MTRIFTIALLTLGDPQRLTGGYLYHRRMAEMAPRFDARIVFISFPSIPFPLPTLAAPFVMRRAREGKVSILVLDSIAAAFLWPWIAIRPPELPMVAMLHQPPGGIDHATARSHIQAWLDRRAYAGARRLLVASDALAEELERDGVRRERMTVIPPGRDVAPAPPASVPALRLGRRAAFVCVGNWIERKGIHSLLEAFARLPADLGTLHLAGDDRADPRYAARIWRRLKHPDLQDRVVVHGPLTREEVAALYQGADVFVLPSLKEPYGTVYGEAMAFGLPVVGWQAGNLPYLAQDGREGVLVAPGDVVGLARALEALALDEVQRRAMGEAARQRALQRPTWEQSAELFFGSIRAILDGK